MRGTHLRNIDLNLLWAIQPLLEERTSAVPLEECSSFPDVATLAGAKEVGVPAELLGG